MLFLLAFTQCKTTSYKLSFAMLKPSCASRALVAQAPSKRNCSLVLRSFICVLGFVFVFWDFHLCFRFCICICICVLGFVVCILGLLFIFSILYLCLTLLGHRTSGIWHCLQWLVGRNRSCTESQDNLTKMKS